MAGDTSLTPGGNAPLTGGDARAEVTAAGTAIDVSAVLLTAAGKVRADSDLVFYNHPAQDGVTVTGPAVGVDFRRMPAEVRTVAVVASVDAERPGAVFDGGSGLRVEVTSGGHRISYEPPPSRHGETVVVLAEFYRRADAWKVRAVGQGYADGLAGLAQDFGVVVDDPGPARGSSPAPATNPPQPGPPPPVEHGRGPATVQVPTPVPSPLVAPPAAPPAWAPPPPHAAAVPLPPPPVAHPAPPAPPTPPPAPPVAPPPSPYAPPPSPYAPSPYAPTLAGGPGYPPPPPAPTSAPAISLAKVERAAPALVNLYKQAGISLQKRGLSGQRAAVYLVLDHSASMKSYYRSGIMQHLAEQVLGLSANLDDDGVVPLVFFSSRVDLTSDISLDNHAGRVEALHQRLSWGGTTYAPAMRAVIDHYQSCGATDPAFVIFQTDGEPFDRGATKKLLQQTSTLPIFWQFVGFGNTRLKFLRTLDTLKGRVIDNAGFFAAGDNPHDRPDADLYDALMSGFPTWLKAAREARVIH